MKKLFSVLSAAYLLLSAPIAMAHGNHIDVAPIDAIAASEKAQHVLSQLVKSQKVNAVWKGVKAESISTTASKTGNTIWVIKFVSPEQQTTAQQDVYVMLDELGNTIAVNNNGKL